MKTTYLFCVLLLSQGALAGQEIKIVPQELKTSLHLGAPLHNLAHAFCFMCEDGSGHSLKTTDLKAKDAVSAELEARVNPVEGKEVKYVVSLSPKVIGKSKCNVMDREFVALPVPKVRFENQKYTWGTEELNSLRKLLAESEESRSHYAENLGRVSGREADALIEGLKKAEARSSKLQLEIATSKDKLDALEASRFVELASGEAIPQGYKVEDKARKFVEYRGFDYVLVAAGENTTQENAYESYFVGGLKKSGTDGKAVLYLDSKQEQYRNPSGMASTSLVRMPKKPSKGSCSWTLPVGQKVELPLQLTSEAAGSESKERPSTSGSI